jgi:TolA-binding protein
LEESPPTWQALAASGKNHEALAAVLPRFDDECSHGSAADLMALADVARYAGDTGRARTALLAVRTRFSGTSRAVTAAFLLGRLALDGGAFADAVKWFQAASAEAGSGPLARDAEGRLIEAREKAGDHAGARQTAQHYLQLYPGGPHASLAIQVLER